MDRASATIEAGRDAWILRVASCPLCNRVTTHGGGAVTEPPVYGDRKAHCCGGTITLVPAGPPALPVTPAELIARFRTGGDLSR